MGDCKSCSGCGGCGSQLELTDAELSMLEKLSSIPFLPIARRREDMIPVYLEDEDYPPQQYSAILQHTIRKSTGGRTDIHTHFIMKINIPAIHGFLKL